MVSTDAAIVYTKGDHEKTIVYLEMLNGTRKTERKYISGKITHQCLNESEKIALLQAGIEVTSSTTLAFQRYRNNGVVYTYFKTN